MQRIAHTVRYLATQMAVFFEGSSSYHETFGATQVVGSSIAGEKGIAIDSGNNTEVVASTLIASKAEETSGEKAPGDQKQADITIHSGGEIVIKGAQEHLDQQAQSSSSGFLHEESSDSSQSHTNGLLCSGCNGQHYHTIGQRDHNHCFSYVCK